MSLTADRSESLSIPGIPKPAQHQLLEVLAALAVMRTRRRARYGGAHVQPMDGRGPDDLAAWLTAHGGSQLTGGVAIQPRGRPVRPGRLRTYRRPAGPARKNVRAVQVIG